MLKKDAKLGMILVADKVMNPLFPSGALNKLQDREKTILNFSKSQPQALTSTLFDQVAYPEGHPYGRPFPSVGDIDAVDTSILLKQLDSDLIPIISPLSADESGTLLNINADTVAAALAVALGAETLMLATGAPGILESADDPRSVISYLDIAGLARLRDEGRLTDGMLPKAAAIEQALMGGVPRVHVIAYDLPDSLLLEVFTNEGMGTLVVNDIQNLSVAEQQG